MVRKLALFWPFSSFFLLKTKFTFCFPIFRICRRQKKERVGPQSFKKIPPSYPKDKLLGRGLCFGGFEGFFSKMHGSGTSLHSLLMCASTVLCRNLPPPRKIPEVPASQGGPWDDGTPYSPPAYMRNVWKSQVYPQSCYMVHTFWEATLRDYPCDVGNIYVGCLFS